MEILKLKKSNPGNNGSPKRGIKIIYRKGLFGDLKFSKKFDIEYPVIHYNLYSYYKLTPGPILRSHSQWIGRSFDKKSNKKNKPGLPHTMANIHRQWNHVLSNKID